MFCTVYDSLGTQPPLGAMITRRDYTPEQSDSQLDRLLVAVEYRYHLWLQLLTSVQNRPKQTWPLPPWCVVNSA
jgi:hypothetical protein